MDSLEILKNKVLTANASSFSAIAMDIFRYQFKNNPVYQKYIESLGIKYSSIQSFDDIPFLPIEFFKTHDIKSGQWKEQAQFLSSGTTSSTRSCHFIEDIEFYHFLCRQTFNLFFPSLNEEPLYALLPSYQEQGNSGLISMIDFFMSKKKNNQSGYFLNDFKSLETILKQQLSQGKKPILFGVSYALLEFGQHVKSSLSGVTILETGGMKGRGPEYTREELHQILKTTFNVDMIHSEYGMTELMSQAYSLKDGKFSTPTSMKIVIRDINDPFARLGFGKLGGINVVDLANIHSCSFIETQDLGKLNNDGTFEVSGRIDNSDIRGCNLLVS